MEGKVGRDQSREWRGPERWSARTVGRRRRYLKGSDMSLDFPIPLALGLLLIRRVFLNIEEAPGPPESLAIGSSDLRYLLSSHNVDELSQAKLFENGIDTLAKFAAFVTSEDELTKVLKASFGLDPESSLKVRGQVASYLVAWQTAKAN